MEYFKIAFVFIFPLAASYLYFGSKHMDDLFNFKNSSTSSVFVSLMVWFWMLISTTSLGLGIFKWWEKYIKVDKNKVENTSILFNKDITYTIDSVLTFPDSIHFTHPYFGPNEFIYVRNGKIYDEDGVEIKNFIKNRNFDLKWSKDWKIYP